MDQNSQRFALWGAKKYFPCFEKGKTFFLKIKRTFNKEVKVFQKFKLFSTTDNNLKHILLYICT
jgi:hypothetical protein